MKRTAARARKNAASLPESLPPLVAAWWDTVVTGEADDPHPIHGERLLVRLSEGQLKLSGEVESKRDRDELVSQARAQLGRGVTEVDAGDLKITRPKEKAGVLDQNIVAVFPNSETAELALKFVLERSRFVFKQKVILALGAKLAIGVVPVGFEADVREQLEMGRAALILRVDETAVFRVRALLDEDTRSLWTVTTPPQVAL
jgi:hypothetical protein